MDFAEWQRLNKNAKFKFDEHDTCGCFLRELTEEQVQSLKTITDWSFVVYRKAGIVRGGKR